MSSTAIDPQGTAAPEGAPVDRFYIVDPGHVCEIYAAFLRSAPIKPEIDLLATPSEVTPPLPGDREILAPAAEVPKRRRPFRKPKGGSRDTAKK